MFKSNWIITAIFGLALATSGQAQEQTEGTQEETKQEKEESYTPPIPFPVEIFEKQSAADARQSREQESRRHEIADLVAQEGMNAATQSIESATRDMRDYSFYSTIAVCVGTFLAFFAFILSYFANKAARDAVEVMRNEQRPWIKAKAISCEFRIDKQGQIWLSMQTRFENIGNTPVANFDFVESASYLDQIIPDRDFEGLKSSARSHLVAEKVLFPEENTTVGLQIVSKHIDFTKKDTIVVIGAVRPMNVVYMFRYGNPEFGSRYFAQSVSFVVPDAFIRDLEQGITDRSYKSKVGNIIDQTWIA